VPGPSRWTIVSCCVENGRNNNKKAAAAPPKIEHRNGKIIGAKSAFATPADPDAKAQCP